MADMSMGAETVDEILSIGVERVHPGRWQPRDRERITDESVAELAADIKKRGVLTPLLGAPIEGEGPIEVELVAGERRLHAARVAGLTAVPVKLVRGTEAELAEMAIVDNLQREDLTPIEEARALKRLQELYEYSQRQLASHLNKSQPWVQQRLALLGAAPGVQEMVNTRVFSLAHARALSGLPEAVQERTAEHFGTLSEKGVMLTSRQVQNTGRQVRQFLDPSRFEGVERELLLPAMRNGMITIRHLLQTLPEEELGKAVERVLQDGPGSDARKLMGRKELRSVEDVLRVARLLVYREKWGGCWDHSDWWKREIAEATGRTCEACIFYGEEPPEAFRSWDPPCLRWCADEPSELTSCSGCILPTDEAAIELSPHWMFDGDGIKKFGYQRYVESVDECKRIVSKVAAEQAAQKDRSESKREEDRGARLRAFRETCQAAARDLEPQGVCPMDVDHFQAQWCARCEFGWQSDECAFIEHPIGGSYDQRPQLYALVQIETDQDNDGKTVRRAARVVPRCEMFRWTKGPVIAQTGGISFPEQRRERQKSAMRWLRAMLSGCKEGYNSYYKAGLWSPLRWLPYDRPREKHYHLGRLVKWILNEWDNDLGDARVATLMTAAASEATVMGRSSFTTPMRLFNPCTAEDEEWLSLEWRYLDGLHKPHWWPDKIEWPFTQEADSELGW